MTARDNADPEFQHWGAGPAQAPAVIVDDAAARLRAAAAQFMTIDDTTYGDGERYAVRFRGRLVLDSAEAYKLAAEAFRPLGFTPLFRKEGDRHAVLALRGIINPPASRALINYALFLLTVLSVLFTGATYGWDGPLPSTAAQWPAFLLSGWPFLLSMLGILLAHELGHYFAARYHGVSVTLPYFLPFPFSPFGTLGAFIRLKSPPTNRRVLLDIGVAGPLAGLIVALPVLIYGLWTSPVQPIPAAAGPGQLLSFEGNSILYALIKRFIFGQFLPAPADYGGLPPLLYMLRFYVAGFPPPIGGTDVILNDVAWAGWAGLLVTGLNLIPAGQLDGGHALYVLIGDRTRKVLPYIIIVLIGLGFLWSGWFLYAALIFFMGRANAEPLDTITELDGRRKAVAVLVLIIFVLVITPVPLILV
jgi:membrane-associated protease RseP (regulator of RpoE activity)